MAGSPSPATAHHRARVAALTTAVRAGYRRPDELDAARRGLDVAKLEDHVSRVIAGWPPLTGQQLDRIAALLRAGRQPVVDRKAAVQARIAELDGGAA